MRSHHHHHHQSSGGSDHHHHHHQQSGGSGAGHVTSTSKSMETLFQSVYQHTLNEMRKKNNLDDDVICSTLSQNLKNTLYVHTYHTYHTYYIYIYMCVCFCIISFFYPCQEEKKTPNTYIYMLYYQSTIYHFTHNRTKHKVFPSLNIFAFLDSLQSSDKSTQAKDNVEILSAHALAILSLQNDKIKDKNSASLIVERAKDFLLTCTQVSRHVQAELRIICEFLLKSQIQFGQEAVRLLVQPFYNALTKSRARISILTALHPILLQACLISKSYNIALRVLSSPVVEVQPKITNFTIQDYVLFYYYAARVYIACKQFKIARRLLLECIATPSEQDIKSAISMEAYKYLVLVSLIIDGSMPKTESMPKYVNRSVVTAAEKLNEEYVRDSSGANCLPTLASFLLLLLLLLLLTHTHTFLLCVNSSSQVREIR